MNANVIRISAIALTILAVSATAKAQLAVRDNDSEARNAYQETCFAARVRSFDQFLQCSPSALPPDKRLAVRFINASCAESGATRNHLVVVAGKLVSGGKVASHFIPRRANALSGSRLFLAEPVFFHTDAAPEMSAHWEGDGSVNCFMTVFGYLINR